MRNGKQSGYQTPTLTVVVFESADIVRTSDGVLVNYQGVGGGNGWGVGSFDSPIEN